MPRRAAVVSAADLDLRQHVDNLVEHCERTSLSLKESMRLVLPLLRQRLEARLVFVSCPDERLAQCYFWDGAPQAGLSDAVLASFRERVIQEGRAARALGRGHLLGEALDFAGQRIGIVGALFDRPPQDPADAAAVLHAFSEQIDGYVGSTMAERRKQRLLVNLSSAMKHPVLETGIRQALDELRKEIRFSAFLLVYMEEQEQEEQQPVVRLIADGSAEVQNLSPEKLSRALLSAPRRTGAPSPALYRLLKRIGLSTFVHEQLITGVKDETVLGGIIVSSVERAFSTFELDVLRILTGLLRLRLIDFNRERRGLLRSFAPAHARRLLSEVGYTRRHLAPRRKTLAIMFADIDNFTSISEQKLRKPEAVLRMVDEWSTGVRDIVHRHMGVLDKIIGDCTLALFGPPFFAEDYGSEDEAVRDFCLRALRTAIETRDYTETMRVPGGRLRAGTGLNVAPLAVGMMGVGENYTGYGSGMNETARLQDLADGGDILVSEAFFRRLGRGHGFRFGPLQRRGVSGVKQPLPYRALLRS